MSATICVNLHEDLHKLPYRIDTQRHFLCQISHFGFPLPKHHRHCKVAPLQHQYLPLPLHHFPMAHTNKQDLLDLFGCFSFEFAKKKNRFQRIDLSHLHIIIFVIIIQIVVANIATILIGCIGCAINLF